MASQKQFLVSSTIRDLSARRKAQQALRESDERFHLLVDGIRDYAIYRLSPDGHVATWNTGASHDLQEPPRMVASYTQRLSRRYRGKLDQDADDGATRMTALIDALLEYARAGTRAKQPVPTDTAALIDQVIADYSLAVQEQAGRITRGDLPIVAGDPVQVRQLFQNLIGNAPKYHGPAR